MKKFTQVTMYILAMSALIAVALYFGHTEESVCPVCKHSISKNK